MRRGAKRSVIGGMIGGMIGGVRRAICALVFVMLAAMPNAFGWSKKGHDVIAHIAQRRLTPQAEERVTELLQGRSMVYYANWMDEIRGQKEYKHTTTWHYINIEKGQTLQTTEREKRGDLLTAIEQVVEVLKSGETKYSQKEQGEALRMLIHMVGDLHQPMHVGRKKDLGGNTIPIQFFNESTNLHSLWDGKIVEAAHNWSYTEWANELDREGLLSDEKSRRIVHGDSEEWLEQVRVHTDNIYRKSPPQARLAYDYVAEFTPVVEELLLTGGVRLAHILNEIYR